MQTIHNHQTFGHPPTNSSWLIKFSPLRILFFTNILGGFFIVFYVKCNILPYPSYGTSNVNMLY